MPNPDRPCLNPADDLTTPATIDLNAALSDLQRQRTAAGPRMSPPCSTRATHRVAIRWNNW